MSIDLYAVAESLQNARDHLVAAKANRGMQRDHEINCARENVRDAMKLLGIKEAPHNGD